MKSVAEFIPLRPFFVASIALLSLALVLGGASQGNLIPATIVEIASLIMVPWAIYRLSSEQGFRPVAFPLGLIAAAAVVIILQIIPLPPALWGQIPGQDHVKAIYAAAGVGLPWRPISLAPDLTIKSSMALVTGVTVFLSWLTLNSRERRFAIGTILAWLVAGLLVGALQITSGGQSPAYFYERTNYGSLVGFFSNRNHEASLLLCALPFAAALIAHANQKKLKGGGVIVLGTALAFTVVLALAAVKSRAGLLLLGPSLIASFLIASSSSRLFRNKRTWLIGGGVLIVAAILIAKFALEPLLSRFELSVSDDLRFQAAPDVWRAVLMHLPFGSGLGTFNDVYRSVERLEMVTPAYFNHAHNDYLELLLELGLPGIALAVGVIGWVVARAVKIWGSESQSGSHLARAGVVVLAILLLHSSLDYPLRTLALGAVFGFAGALIATTAGAPSRSRTRLPNARRK